MLFQNRLRDYQPELYIELEFFNSQENLFILQDISSLVLKCQDVQRFDGVGSAQIDIASTDSSQGWILEPRSQPIESSFNAITALWDITDDPSFHGESISSIYFYREKDYRNNFYIERMSFIFIWKKDIFGYWNKKFSGIVTNITFNYSPGSVPTFTLICKDFKRLLQISEIVLQKALGGNQIIQSLQQALQKQVAALTNIFAGKLSYEIIAYILNSINIFDKMVNDIIDKFKFPYRRRFLCNTYTFYPGKVSIANFPGLNYAYPYRYETTLNQNTNVFKGFYYTISDKNDVIEESSRLRYRIYKGSDSGLYLNFFAVDESIVHGFTGSSALTPIYEKMFRQFTTFWRNEYVTAETVCKKVADMMFGFFYCDADGNYILSQPLLNNVPSISKDRFDDRDSYGMPSHGYNYIITDYSLLNLGLDTIEDDIYTSVEVPGSYDYGLPNGSLAELYFGLYPNQTFLGELIGGDLEKISKDPSKLKYLKQLWVFGSRSIKTNPIVGILDKDRLDAAAKALYNRFYFRGFNATFNFEGRSDFQLGRTVYSSYNDYLYLPLVITDTLIPGESHTVNLSCSYGHPIEYYIENPWDAISQNDKVLREFLEYQKKLGNNINAYFRDIKKQQLSEAERDLFVGQYLIYKKNNPKDTNGIVDWYKNKKYVNDANKTSSNLGKHSKSKKVNTRIK